MELLTQPQGRVRAQIRAPREQGEEGEQEVDVRTWSVSGRGQCCPLSLGHREQEGFGALASPLKDQPQAAEVCQQPGSSPAPPPSQPLTQHFIY